MSTTKSPLSAGLGLYKLDHSWFLHHSLITAQTWHVQSRPQGNLPVARPQGNNWQQRQPGSPHQQQEESRNLTGTVQEPSPSVRSDVTRSPLSFSSASSHSSVSSVRSPRTSKPTWDSSHPPSWPSRRHQRLTWSDSSRIPTFAQSTPSVWPSCQRISSWPDVSVERELKFFILSQTKGIFQCQTFIFKIFTVWYKNM